MEESREHESQEMKEERGLLLYAKRLAIAEKNLASRDLAVTDRAASGIERIWREDMEMVDDYSTSGFITPASTLDYATGVAFLQTQNQEERSKVKINVIRNRCEIAWGRFGEVTLPTDDRNWGLKRTPVPEMAELEDNNEGAYQGNKPIVKEDGTQASIADVARTQQALADKKMIKMENIIDDQTTECDLNAEQRKLQWKSITLGTGVVKGPYPVNKTNYSWERIPLIDEETGEHRKKDGKLLWTWELEKIKDVVPSAKSVDPRRCYPDFSMGNNPERGAMWEEDTIRPLEVANLIGVPGYDESMIREVLEEEPIHVGSYFNDKFGKHKTTRIVKSKGDAYQRWEYNGPISRSDLEDLGCDVSKMGVKSSKVSGRIIYINDKPVKSIFNALDNNESPYSFFPWTEIDGSPFGIGLPRRARDLQRVIIAAWQKMMDNAGDSSGVNFVLGPDIEPVDGNWTLDGKKAWRSLADSASDDVRKAFATFQADNRQPELAEIIELALKFLDIETGIPQIFQGEMQKNPETLGQTNIIVDSANISLRSRVKLYDDKIIDPLITRFYHYNMHYHDDESAKGDYQVDTRGTSVLLERDTQAKTLAGLFQFKGDPDIDANTDWDLAVEEWYSNMKISHVYNTSDKREAKRKMQQEAGSRPDPSIEAAKIRAEGQKMELEAKMALAEKEMAFKAEQSELERKDKNIDRQFNLQLKEMEREIEMMKLAQEENLSLEDIKRSLTETSAKLQTQKEISFGTGKGQQVLKPPTEPPGRAPNGEAFPR